jgi:hypothetical protein
MSLSEEMVWAEWGLSAQGNRRQREQEIPGPDNCYAIALTVI